MLNCWLSVCLYNRSDRCMCVSETKEYYVQTRDEGSLSVESM